MQPDGILETVLYATDLDAAEQFYGGILNLRRVTRAGNRHVFFVCGNQMLLVFNPEETRHPPRPGALPVPPHGASGPGHVCFRADAEGQVAWQRHLAGNGVEVEAIVDWPQGGRSFYIRDPAGNSVEFAEPRIWGL